MILLFLVIVILGMEWHILQVEVICIVRIMHWVVIAPLI